MNILSLKSLCCCFLLFIITPVAFAQTDLYKPGYYYDLNGTRVDGYIYYDFSDIRNFRFKKSDHYEFSIISPSEASSFVRGRDSFTVVKKYQLKGSPFNKHTDFMRVLVSGEIILYTDYSITVSSGSHDRVIKRGEALQKKTYLLHRMGSNIIEKVSKTKGAFRKQMIEFFQDDEPIVAQLNSKEIVWDLLPEIVKDYNSRH